MISNEELIEVVKCEMDKIISMDHKTLTNYEIMSMLGMHAAYRHIYYLLTGEPKGIELG